MRSTRDAQLRSNVAASDATPFSLDGGEYMVMAMATWGGGSLDVQKLGPDGSTYVSVLAATFLANGLKTFKVPAGLYKIIIATATAVYVEIVRIPGE